MASPRPVIRLRPKVPLKRIERGSPWIYSDWLVRDRRMRALSPGTLAVLETADRRQLGLYAVTPEARLAARRLDADPAARIDAGWFARRVEAALAWRQRAIGAPYYRLIHGEADALSGVIVDRFGPALALQPNAAWAEAHQDALTEALVRVTGAETVVKNAAGRGRALEGLDDQTRVIHGALDGPVEVRMNAATYLADLTGGQKTGVYYDQRPNHAFVSGLARGASVLDLFTHTGGFALAALAGGAARALAVDSSAPALELALQGAMRTGASDRLETRRGEVTAVLRDLEAGKDRFDVVVSDPPAYAPNRAARDKGLAAYRRLARDAARRVAPGGVLVVCSCSHAADLAAFREASAAGITAARREAQLVHTGFAGPDHPVLPELPEQGYLKVLVFRVTR